MSDESDDSKGKPVLGRKITQAPPPPTKLPASVHIQRPGNDFDYWAGRAGEPDWPYWLNLAVVDYEDACYLSFNIDPQGARRLRDSDRFLNVKGRVQIAESHLGDGLPSYLTEDDRYYDRDGTGVKLSEFRAWAEALPAPFTFPDGFPKGMVQQVKNVAPEGARWPWGGHETALLRKLAAAAAKFWTLYDPADPSTAPTNADVEAWLIEQGVAERSAEVMATILRADGLRMGPRK